MENGWRGPALSLCLFDRGYSVDYQLSLIVYRSSGVQWLRFVAEQAVFVLCHSVGITHARWQLSSVG